MTRRHLLLAAAVAGLLVAGIALALRPIAAEAEGDDLFDPLRERLMTFETAYFELPKGMSRRGTVQQPAQLYLSARGRLAYDNGRDSRWIWTGDQIYRVSYTTVPVDVDVLPAPPQVAEVWAEVRSGFAHSTLRHVDPTDLGYTELVHYDNEDTILVELPFAWARDYAVFLTHSPEGGHMNRLEVADRRTKEVVHTSRLGDLSFAFDREAAFWDVPLERSVFEPCAVPGRQSRRTFPDLPRGMVSPYGAQPLKPWIHLPHEVCEELDGHHHGAQLHQEHTDDEIHGGAVGDRGGCRAEERGHGDEHGQDDQPHGQDDQPHGQDDQPHGKAKVR